MQPNYSDVVWGHIKCNEFLLRERREGNRILNHVVNYLASGCGRESLSY